ncbi:hypothetical protein EJ05DRAFT_283895 [Pseudovirgaria hyperparasitica]|uniref:Uncharacterized protein n=1 Tax=Pseudovirgaria hyperparasitica TaxID=470096 RepID=A0A6A6WCJ9_9PEZI|nr:uncharacterized protein EJ05DRAFT_283895 [Pseudovirgaria hyperparasitica]KAF2760433.1 hypothetical protein EJ05DRAFT_283895 [Pseudovirgaria hyperparasitica]
MADVRSMLRQERAAREQSKTKRRAPVPPTIASTSKKRKASDDDEVAQTRKKNKAKQDKSLPSGYFEAESAVEEKPVVETPAPVQAEQPKASATITAAVPPIAHIKDSDVDEDEWAAFQREVAMPPSEETNRAAILALNTNAVIAAAPLTAADLAAQAREEQSAQRGRRDAELEEEKEEAARHLEEEFDEMEELEERVRKLREKREALRRGREASQKAPITSEAVTTPKPDEPEGSSDEGSDEDWDDWRFKPA